jgi:hypothetical protein
MTKTCPICKKEFETRNVYKRLTEKRASSAKYCSKICGAAYFFIKAGHKLEDLHTAYCRCGCGKAIVRLKPFNDPILKGHPLKKEETKLCSICGNEVNKVKMLKMNGSKFKVCNDCNDKIKTL